MMIRQAQRTRQPLEGLGPKQGQTNIPGEGSLTFRCWSTAAGSEPGKGGLQLLLQESCPPEDITTPDDVNHLTVSSIFFLLHVSGC